MSAIALASVLLTAGSLLAQVAIDGKPVVWHPLTLTFQGPEAAETDRSPNPFLDIRLQVTFSGPSGEQFNVPGFFDGDGNGGPKGRAWRVRFAPNAAGTWKYAARFRTGANIAIDLDPNAGQPLALGEMSGTFDVAPRDSAAPGFLKWGR